MTAAIFCIQPNLSSPPHKNATLVELLRLARSNNRLCIQRQLLVIPSE